MTFSPQTPAELPLHLYESSVANLTAKEAEQLLDLLLDFSNVFSEGSHDLGRTDVVKHQINNGAADSLHTDYLLLKEKKLLKQLTRCQSKE